MSEDLQEPTDDLGVLHILAHNAHAVLAEYEVCPKCCKDHAKRQSESQSALDAIQYVSESLDFAKSRLMQIPELDAFAHWICTRYSGAERRIIRTALNVYYKQLGDKIESVPLNPYSPEMIERGLVSGCILDLCEQL